MKRVLLLMKKFVIKRYIRFCKVIHIIYLPELFKRL